MRNLLETIMLGILRMPDAADSIALPADVKADAMKTADLNRKVKTNRPTLPFSAAIFSKPDRVIKMDRTNKKGEKTGVVAQLMADVLVPLLGGVGIIKTSIWCDSKYDREAGGYVETYNLSLGRNFFVVADGQRDEYDGWRQSVLDQYEKWLETDAAKTVSAKMSSAPRLVKIRKVADPVQPLGV